MQAIWRCWTAGRKPAPHPDLPAAIVYAAQGLNVRMTMVQGKVLYQDGEFPTLDKEKIIWKAEEAARQLGVY